MHDQSSNMKGKIKLVKVFLLKLDKVERGEILEDVWLEDVLNFNSHGSSTYLTIKVLLIINV